MPCDTIQTAKVEIGKVSPDLLALAMKKLGLAYQYSAGILQVKVRAERLSELIPQIKRQYATEVVFSQAKKFGWQLKSKGEFQWEAIKR